MHLTEDNRTKKGDDEDEKDPAQTDNDAAALGMDGANPLAAEESIEEDDAGGD